MLTVFAAPFALSAATQVLDTPPEQAEQDLSYLENRTLLLHDPQTGRFRLYDLKWPVARNAFGYSGAEPSEKAEEKRLYEIALWHSTHFRDVLGVAGALYLQGGEDTLISLAVFDAESQNIRAGQMWAAKFHLSDNDAALLCSLYAGRDALLGLRQLPGERIDWLILASASAKRLGDEGSEAVHMSNLGSAYLELRNPQTAIEYLELGLEINKREGDRRGEGSALGNLVIAHRQLGKPQQAIDFCERQLKITRDICDAFGEGNALGNIGLAYADLGNHTRAIENYQMQIEIAHGAGNRRGEGNALYNWAVEQVKLGEIGEAIEKGEAALKIYEQIEDPNAEKVRQALAEWRSQQTP